MDNRFQRTRLLLGDDGFAKLQKAHVAVFESVENSKEDVKDAESQEPE